MLAFWESVTDLRRIELVALLVGILTPVLCGTILLTVRARVKTLMDRSSRSQGFSNEESVRKLETQIRHLEADLAVARQELGGLRRVTAPRALTEADQDSIVQRLRHAQGAPVIVAALVDDEESYAYATQIAASLRQAGWGVSLNRASMNDFRGVGLATVNLMQRPLAVMRPLAAALAAAHVDARERTILPDSIAGSLQDGSLLVVVGRK